MTSILDQLRSMTTVVADTGDIDAVARLKPVDCTTNPSIVLKALGTEQFADTLNEAISWGKGQSSGDVTAAVADRLAISVGEKLAALVPGRVSTEVDADLSFDTNASVAKAREIIAAYKARGVGQDQILIKLASTWEGHSGLRNPAKRGHRLQSDADVLQSAGDCLCGCGRVSDLAFRGADYGLVQGQDG